MRYPSWAGSAALHVSALAALFLVRPDEILNPPHLLMTSVPFTPLTNRLVPPAPQAMGGGGGNQQTQSARKGRLPRPAPMFLPPTTRPTEIEHALPIEPTIEAAPPTPVSALPIGDPLGLPGPPSDGRGRHGGIGDGDNRGVGNRRGPRAGDGGNVSGAFSLNAVSTPPVLIHKVEPEYSDEARRARFNGTVILRIVIDANGQPTNLEIVRSPGLGLGERAVQSVAKWRFRPGRLDGKPVAVLATVEVNFSLL